MTKTKFFTLFSIISICAGMYVYAGVSSLVQDEDTRIPGKYIVVLKDDVLDTDQKITTLEKKHGIVAENRYSHALKGFSVRLSDEKLTKLKADGDIAFISQDRIVQAIGKSGTPVTSATQVTPSGIQRIGASNFVNKGTGIGVAVIDTGIDLTHPDLAMNISSSSKSCVTGTRSANDDNGHGTHVAGIIAARNNTVGVVGVAPETKLFAVKVLNKNGSGSWSSIICGIDWVTANAKALHIQVANMSLGGAGTSDNNCGLSNNDAFHRAICNSTAKGVTYVVAAGNEGANASQFVPSAYNDTVITVSALVDTNGIAGGGGTGTTYGADDTFATFSNFGSVVDIAAPGVAIISTWKGGGYNTISGTSMATPHVAGAAALFLSSNPTATWIQVRDSLRGLGESLNGGHTDPSGLHPEPVLQVKNL